MIIYAITEFRQTVGPFEEVMVLHGNSERIALIFFTIFGGAFELYLGPEGSGGFQIRIDVAAQHGELKKCDFGCAVGSAIFAKPLAGAFGVDFTEVIEY